MLKVRTADNSHLKSLLYLVLTGLVGVHILGTVGYQILTHGQHAWFDSFYMTFITVSTIGFGEVFDMSNNPPARMLTIILGVLGAGTLSMMFSIVTVLFLESDLNGTLKRKRMNKAIAKLKGHYILCGLGRVGGNVAHELQTTLREYVAIDEKTDALHEYQEKNHSLLSLHGDASDDDILIQAGIFNAAGIFAVTGDDSMNLMITITAKQIRPDIRVVARAHEVRNIEKLKKAGADSIVSPDFTGGMRIASAMIRPHVVTFLEEMLRAEGDFRIEEINIPANFTKRPIATIMERNDHYILIAVRHADGTNTFNPAPTHVLEAGQLLIVMAGAAGRAELLRMLSN